MTGPDQPRAASAYTQPRRRRHAYGLKRGKRSTSEWVGLAMLVAGALVVLGGLWIGITALIARSQLTSARDDVRQLRAQIVAGDQNAAERTLNDLRSHAGKAHWLTEGPAWWVGAQIPAGGEPLESVRGVAAAVDELGDNALPQLLQARRELDPAVVRRSDGAIDLAALQRTAPQVIEADHTVQAARNEVEGLDASTWLRPVDHARTDLLAQLDQIAGPVHSAAATVQVLPTMLGANGTKRYFVGFQNEAEARGTGGIPGAFGILEATKGKLHFQRFESDSFFDGASADADLGADFDQLWGGARPDELYINSNVSPNFPYAAQLWTSYYQRKTGQRLDGALAFDPTALSYLLGVTGPATLPSGGVVSADNVVSLTQSQLYSKYPTGAQNAARKKYLVQVAKAASERLVKDLGNPADLLKAVQRSVDERRLLVWSGDAAVQDDLHATDAGGEILRTDAPYVGPVALNDVGGKLDYYVERGYSWKRTGCGATRDVTLTATFTNTAPASGLPPYVTDFQRPTKTKAGSTHLRFLYYATHGAKLASATVNGATAFTGLGAERGHPVLSVPVDLPQGATTTVVLHLTEPVASGSPVVLKQPSVRPATFEVQDAMCG